MLADPTPTTILAGILDFIVLAICPTFTLLAKVPSLVVLTNI